MIKCVTCHDFRNKNKEKTPPPNLPTSVGHRLLAFHPHRKCQKTNTSSARPIRTVGSHVGVQSCWHKLPMVTFACFCSNFWSVEHVEVLSEHRCNSLKIWSGTQTLCNCAVRNDSHPSNPSLFRWFHVQFGGVKTRSAILPRFLSLAIRTQGLATPLVRPIFSMV